MSQKFKLTIEIDSHEIVFTCLRNMDEAIVMAQKKIQDMDCPACHSDPFKTYPNFKPIILYGFSPAENIKMFCEPVLITPEMHRALDKQYGRFGMVYCLYRR